MYKLAFDLFSNHRTGVYRYGRSLAKHICYHLQDYPLSVYFLLDRTMSPPVDRSELSSEVNSKIDFVRCDRSSLFLPELAELRDWMMSDHIDLYYSSNYLIDLKCPIKFMFTIHDLTRLIYPSYSYTDSEFIAKYGLDEYERLKVVLAQMEGVLPDELSKPFSFLQFFWTANLYLAQKAEHVFTVSYSVKDELTRFLKIPDNKISVVSGGARKDIIYRRSTQDVNSVLDKLDVVSPYCLCVGFRHRHKRLRELLDMVDIYRMKLPANGKLILVGEDDEQGATFKKIILEKNLSQFVQSIGYVNDDQLSCLYTGAKATIIASISEGFCLPAQESLVCGTNVLLPDIQVMRETVGDAAHFYPINELDKLVELIAQALRQDLIDKTNLFSNQYSWPLAAKQFLDAIINHM